MHNKLILGLTAATLTAVVAVGGTLAFMTNKTAQMTNKFTAAPGLTGELREPGWDGYEFGDTTTDGSQPTGDTISQKITDDAAKAALGLTVAGSMRPGDTIGKNPILKNTSTIPVYMGIKVTYTDWNSDPAKIQADRTKFEKIADLSSGGSTGVSGQWYLYKTDGASDYYFFKGGSSENKLTAVGTADGENTTNNLFDSVVIKKDISTKELTDNQFNIVIVGGEVQAVHIDTDADYTLAEQQLYDELSKA